MQKRKIVMLSASVAALFLASASIAHAEKTSRPGAGKTANCEACHGPKGGAPVNNLMPKICGQNHDYLVMTLGQFRDGHRPSAIMREATKGVSDELIEQLATYFSQANCGK